MRQCRESLCRERISSTQLWIFFFKSHFLQQFTGQIKGQNWGQLSPINDSDDTCPRHYPHSSSVISPRHIISRPVTNNFLWNIFSCHSGVGVSWSGLCFQLTVTQLCWSRCCDHTELHCTVTTTAHVSWDTTLSGAVWPVLGGWSEVILAGTPALSWHWAWPTCDQGALGDTRPVTMVHWDMTLLTLLTSLRGPVHLASVYEIFE